MTESSTKTAPPVVPFGKYKGQVFIGFRLRHHPHFNGASMAQTVLRHYQKVPKGKPMAHLAAPLGLPNGAPMAQMAHFVIFLRLPTG